MTADVHPLAVSDPGFSTAAMDAIFSVTARVDAMCRVEAALAWAYADSGLLEPGVAAAIEAACAVSIDDPADILRKGWEVGTPLIPLLALLRGRLDDEPASVLHRGATSQDIIDSTMMLQAHGGLTALIAGVRQTAGHLAAIAAEHRGTPMAARTFLQHAGATTFGATAAGWLSMLAARITALEQLQVRLPVQLAGPLGTRSGLGEPADAITSAFAGRLGLAVPQTPWHTDRAIVADVAMAAAGVARSAAKVAIDLVLLAQTEVAEVQMRPGGSSVVPDKRNPFDAVHAIAASEACTAVAMIITAPRAPELQRAAGSWHAEWFAWPLVFQTAGATVESLQGAVESLAIDADRMGANLSRPPEEEELRAAGELVDRALASWSPAS